MAAVGGGSGGGATNVVVAIRSRPALGKEVAVGLAVTAPPDGRTIHLRDGSISNPERAFTFDYVQQAQLETAATDQAAVYTTLGTPLVRAVVEGYNASVFAYGQTGSGKSFTMFSGGDGGGGGGGGGIMSPAASARSAPTAMAGFIPRFCHALFTRIADEGSGGGKASGEAPTDTRDSGDGGAIMSLRGADDATGASTRGAGALMHTVEASYFQIYNERVSDLLALESVDEEAAPFDLSGGGGGGGEGVYGKGRLRVREDPVTGPFVEGLTWHAVGSYAMVERLLRDGQMTRAVASTNMNAASSRSHAVFTLRYKCTRMDATTGMVSDVTSKVVLVDLAGSERVSKTGAEGQRLREAGSINKSLTALGLVIQALAKRSNEEEKSAAVSAAVHVPYRESVLTWLLKDTLGGNARTVMIATVSPCAMHYEETLSTLRYAERTKMIRQRAVVNEDPNIALIRQLKEELMLLKAELAAARSGGPAAGGGEVVYVDNPALLAKVAELTSQNSLQQSMLQQLRSQWEERLAASEADRSTYERHLQSMGVRVVSDGGAGDLSSPRAHPSGAGTTMAPDGSAPPSSIAVEWEDEDWCGQLDEELGGEGAAASATTPAPPIQSVTPRNGVRSERMPSPAGAGTAGGPIASALQPYVVLRLADRMLDGQVVYSLRSGSNTVGSAPSNTITFSSMGVQPHHFTLLLHDAAAGTGGAPTAELLCESVGGLYVNGAPFPSPSTSRDGHGGEGGDRVGGKDETATRLLHTGDRLVFGSLPVVLTYVDPGTWEGAASTAHQHALAGVMMSWEEVVREWIRGGGEQGTPWEGRSLTSRAEDGTSAGDAGSASAPTSVALGVPSARGATFALDRHGSVDMVDSGEGGGGDGTVDACHDSDEMSSYGGQIDEDGEGDAHPDAASMDTATLLNVSGASDTSVSGGSGVAALSHMMALVKSYATRAHATVLVRWSDGRMIPDIASRLHAAAVLSSEANALLASLGSLARLSRRAVWLPGAAWSQLAIRAGEMMDWERLAKVVDVDARELGVTAWVVYADSQGRVNMATSDPIGFVSFPHLQRLCHRLRWLHHNGAVTTPGGTADEEATRAGVVSALCGHITLPISHVWPTVQAASTPTPPALATGAGAVTEGAVEPWARDQVVSISYVSWPAATVVDVVAASTMGGVGVPSATVTTITMTLLTLWGRRCGTALVHLQLQQAPAVPATLTPSSPGGGSKGHDHLALTHDSDGVEDNGSPIALRVMSLEVVWWLKHVPKVPLSIALTAIYPSVELVPGGPAASRGIVAQCIIPVNADALKLCPEGVRAHITDCGSAMLSLPPSTLAGGGLQLATVASRSNLDPAASAARLMPAAPGATPGGFMGVPVMHVYGPSGGGTPVPSSTPSTEPPSPWAPSGSTASTTHVLNPLQSALLSSMAPTSAHGGMSELKLVVLADVMRWGQGRGSTTLMPMPLPWRRGPREERRQDGLTRGGAMTSTLEPVFVWEVGCGVTPTTMATAEPMSRLSPSAATTVPTVSLEPGGSFGIFLSVLQLPHPGVEPRSPGAASSPQFVLESCCFAALTDVRILPVTSWADMDASEVSWTTDNPARDGRLPVHQHRDPWAHCLRMMLPVQAHGAGTPNMVQRLAMALTRPTPRGHRLYLRVQLSVAVSGVATPISFARWLAMECVLKDGGTGAVPMYKMPPPSHWSNPASWRLYTAPTGATSTETGGEPIAHRQEALSRRCDVSIKHPWPSHGSHDEWQSLEDAAHAMAAIGHRTASTLFQWQQPAAPTPPASPSRGLTHGHARAGSDLGMGVDDSGKAPVIWDLLLPPPDDTVKLPRCEIVTVAKGKPERCGYLLKRQARMGGWVRRWYVLQSPYLCTYHTASDADNGAQPSHVLPLAAVVVAGGAPAAGGGGGDDLEFELTLTDGAGSAVRSWRLQGSSMEERAAWVKEIATAAAVCRQIQW